MPRSDWPPQLQWREYSDPAQLAEGLADQVAGWLEQALASRERASLAVSGGRTPVAFFKALARRALPWSRVDITLVDERWVGISDDASNERLVRTHLLSGPPREARFVGLKVDAESPEQGLAACEERLAELSWPLDVAVLGMGNDGHTASLFPGTDGLAQALAPDNPHRCAAIRPLTVPHPRMTLTYAALASARHRALLIQGDDKLIVLEDALGDLNNPQVMPIRAFLQLDLGIFWSP